MILTFRYRMKDRSASTRRELRRQSRAVNFIWNYCCEIDREAARRWKAGMNVRRPSAFDLTMLCAGCPEKLGILSDTIAAICGRFVAARSAIFPKTPSFRSTKRNLDWIPVNMFRRSGRIDGSAIIFRKRRYRLWMSRPIPENGKPKSWNMSCDARGRWYVNIQVEVPEAEKRDGPEIGIDLGLKSLATLSDGRKIEAQQFYRKAQADLAKWQRFGKKKRVRALHAKVANQRKDFLHKVSTELVRSHGRIVVGDVSPSSLKQTKMAKSVSDAGWSMLRQMLLYKAIALGAVVEVVNERHSSVTCSACGARSGPTGYRGLRVRDWVCGSCGAVHDRDTNAALNILSFGAKCRPPVAEIPALAS